VPGSQFARRQLLEPIADNVWYAGEAAHETLWGTVGGAWESGERAADAVLHRLGPVREAAPAEAEIKPKRAPKRARVEPHVERREPRYEGRPQYYQGEPSILAPER
jgi:Flavin containing amine oxidoreductase